MTEPTVVYIGLGSNLDTPAQQIERGLATLAQLPRCQLLDIAPWYQSRALGPGPQPDYLNTAAKLNTLLSPFDLLHQLQQIEDEQGRQRHTRWGARTLDLDILLYGNDCLTTAELAVPHPELTRRRFVLQPLYDLDPELVLPHGQAINQLLAQCKADPLTDYPLTDCDDACTVVNRAPAQLSNTELDPEMASW